MEKLFLSLMILVSVNARARDLEKLYAKTTMLVAKKKIEVYIADDDKGRADGLMFINKLGPNTGMIFIFDEEQPLSFWMKNCVMDLSVGFFDGRGILIDVQEMKAPESLMELSPPAYQSRGSAAFALEMEPGWFTKNHIEKGAKLALTATVKSKLLTRRLPRAQSTDQRRDSPK